MKTFVSKITMLAVLLLGCAALFVTGCDSEDSPDNDRISDQEALDRYFANHPYVSASRYSRDALLQVSPESATVTEVGQQVLFRVVGGSGRYRWDVSNGSRGTIRPDPASSDAIYTARVVANNEVIVYDEVGHAGIAFIMTEDIEALEVDPADVTIGPNGTAILRATGGVPPYHWEMCDNALGSLNTYNGDETAYHHGGTLTANCVRLTDSVGTLRYVSINIEP